MRSRVIQALAVSSLALGVLALAPSPSLAGNWHVYSCGATPTGINPSDVGWSSNGQANGNGSFSSVPSPNCAAGFPEAYLSGLASETPGSYEDINFSAPTGSLITGGSLSFAASATSPNNTAVGIVYIENANNSAFWSCAGAYGQAGPCPSSPSLSADEQATIPNQESSELSLVAECGGADLNGDTCSGSGNPGAPIADARLFASDIQLTTGSVPVINSIEGAATKEAVSETTTFNVSASEPSGPGIYEIYVTVDGSPTKLESASGSEVNPGCVNYGPSKGEEWGFVSTEPCGLSLGAKFTTNIAALSNGAHTLHFTAVDGSGDSTTQSLSITVANPVPPPPPVPPVCVVPKIKAGSTVKSAERSLAAHHCGVGKVKKHTSKKIHKGRVISINGHVNAHLPNGAKIVINVSSGRPRHH